MKIITIEIYLMNTCKFIKTKIKEFKIIIIKKKNYNKCWKNKKNNKMKNKFNQFKHN